MLGGCWGSALPRAAAAGSLRTITTGQRGAARGHGQDAGTGTGVPRYPPATPCGRESLAVTSGDKAPYGDGEGRCLATARGQLGEGAGRGVLLHLPGVFACSAAPTYQGLHSAAVRVGCPSGWQQRGPCGPHAGGGSKQQPAAPATCRATPRPGAGGKGARVTLPCLENMNLHVKVGVGPCPGCQVPRLWRQDHGAVQNGSREGAGARSSWCGASLGTCSGGRQQVGSPGDVEIC